MKAECLKIQQKQEQLQGDIEALEKVAAVGARYAQIDAEGLSLDKSTQEVQSCADMLAASDDQSLLKPGEEVEQVSVQLQGFLLRRKQPNSEGEEGSFSCKEEIRMLGIPGKINARKKDLALLDKQLKPLAEKRHFCESSLDSLSSDIQAFTQELKAAEADGKMRCKRAILVICESVEASKKIEERVRKAFADPEQYGVYRYDRAYRPFEKSRLEAGDIVVATNIAGRGTDLGVSKQVERNGGLHVIMAFMPSNDRVRRQGLGRTARAGHKGTGTYIVLCADGAHAGKSVDEIMRYWDDQEYERLLAIEGERFPKIKVEDALFNKFLRLTEEIKESDACSKKLQLASLQNKWAMWLNEHEHLFNAAHKPGTQQKIDEAYLQFEDQVRSKLQDGPYGLVEEPGELSKWGRMLLDKGKASQAFDCFQQIVRDHPDFSEMAYYYQSIAIIYQDGGSAGCRLAVDAWPSRVSFEVDASFVLALRLYVSVSSSLPPRRLSRKASRERASYKGKSCSVRAPRQRDWPCSDAKLLREA